MGTLRIITHQQGYFYRGALLRLSYPSLAVCLGWQVMPYAIK